MNGVAPRLARAGHDNASDRQYARDVLGHTGVPQAMLGRNGRGQCFEAGLVSTRLTAEPRT
jgi:hypothetical protein